MTTDSVLEITELRKAYGGTTAVDGATQTDIARRGFRRVGPERCRKEHQGRDKAPTRSRPAVSSATASELAVAIDTITRQEGGSLSFLATLGALRRVDGRNQRWCRGPAGLMPTVAPELESPPSEDGCDERRRPNHHPERQQTLPSLHRETQHDQHVPTRAAVKHQAVASRAVTLGQ